MIYETDEEGIIKFKAIITFERYYSSDSGWGVYMFSTTEDIPFCKTGDTEDETDLLFEDDESQDSENNIVKRYGTLAGKMQQLIKGGEYFIKAKHKIDKKYGDQYVPVSVYALIPQTKDQQLTFLKSLVSENIAENLLDAYPNVVNDVANGQLTTIDYSKVKGVREVTWNKIKNKIINNYLISDIISMLRPLGVTFTMIKKLLDDEPNPTLLKENLESNPYILTKIKGLGFKKVDDLALSLKPELIDSPKRLLAYAKYYFTEIGENDGHTWVSEQIFKDTISNIVPECMEYFDWLLNNEKYIYKENNKVGWKKYHDVEMEIIQRLMYKIEHRTHVFIPKETIEKAIKLAEEEQGFTYVKEQVNAIYNVLFNDVSLIIGKAGTGKTSITRAIIKAYTLQNYNITASALSAMAAQRIKEATDFPAMTIHRTLGCTGINKFMFGENNPLITDMAFMDEGSMTNASLFLYWLKAIGDNTRIVISGDHKQLPPIGYGNVFSDLLEVLPKKNINMLVKPMRQAQLSGILTDANLIRENKNPITETLLTRIVHGELQDMFYMFRDNRQRLYDIAIKTYMKTVQDIGIGNVVIAVPRKKGCLNSTLEINKRLQDLLLQNEAKEISSPTIDFKLGAKVAQTVNDYDKNIFNGEIGYITKITKELGDNDKFEDVCYVTYKDSINGDKVIKYNKKEMVQLDLAYAMTCHRLQGSGIHTVIGIIDNTHYKLLDNCMLYTMLTRAKKRCLLLAEPQAFMQCLRTSHNARNTWLSLKDKKGLIE